ncbi:uncharacterized protein [Aristolochia californica]|uniref:uncharacterized protein n=1 Tax=Aristolochia californica TaxID=171875 RepID=UPI0035E3A778
MPRFLTPYQRTRYHLQEFGDNLPRNNKELFDRKHSSLRNTIEQTFGALKARFQMLKDALPFSYKIQMKIVIACCIIHNYVRKKDYNDMFELEDDDSGDELGGGGDEVRLVGVNEDEDSDDLRDEGNLSTTMRRRCVLQSTRAAQFRDAITTSMWSDY